MNPENPHEQAPRAEAPAASTPPAPEALADAAGGARAQGAGRADGNVKVLVKMRLEHVLFLRGLARAALQAAEQAVVTDEAFKDDEEVAARNQRAQNMKRLAVESMQRLTKSITRKK